MKKESKSDLINNYINAFAQIKNDISPEDKQDCEELKGIDLSTISRYLNGNVKDTKIANTLFVFFMSKINARKKTLENLLQNK